MAPVAGRMQGMMTSLAPSLEDGASMTASNAAARTAVCFADNTLQAM